MKRYDISFGAICPKERQWLFEQERNNGYEVRCYGTSVLLEGRNRTADELAKLEILFREFPDHHITIKEVKGGEDG